jgi:DedD protein
LSSALKNRLVGTIIIVALAVIFIPDILDGQKQTNQNLFVAVPEQPASQTIAEVAAFPSEQVRQETQIKVELVPDVAIDDFDMDEVENNIPANDNQTNSQETEPKATASVKKTAEQIDRQVPDPAAAQLEVNLEQDGVQVEAGWVVQLGVFRHQKNVSELLKKLRDAGYRAFSRPVKTSSGELTKVFVGPDLDKDSLAKAIPDLRELTKLQGRIAPYTVK